MSAQWFPGHMTKAIRQIEEILPSVDMIIECRDARVVASSENPIIRDFIPHKPRLIVLTKKDLANPVMTQQWLAAFESQGIMAVAINNHKDPIRQVLSAKVVQAMEPVFERQRKRGIKPRKVRAMIAGVPNVGKSTIVNRLAKRKVVEVQNRPGVTMALTRINVSVDLEIVDSPGLLWPKFESEQQGLHLALCASIKTTGFDMKVVLEEGIHRLLLVHPRALFDRYHTEFSDLEGLLVHLRETTTQTEAEIHNRIYHDIITHQFGPMSWESVDDTL